MLPKQPNILFIMTDQERADVIMPGHICKTPNVERLMKEGVTFTHAFTPMTHCCPARASLMTGQMPSKHGIFNNVQNTSAIHMDLNPGCETWSEKLREADYDLAYTGKWHVSAETDPADCGWEELDIIATGTYNRHDSEPYLGLPREDPIPRKRGELTYPGYGRRQFYGTLDEEVEDMGDYRYLHAGMDRMEDLARKTRPWCLFVGFCGPHGPFVIPEKYATMYDAADMELPPSYGDEMENKSQYYKRMRDKYTEFSDDEVREVMAHYYGYCTMMDDMLGELLDKLEETGQADNTLVIFTSDHGELCGDHGLYAKGIAPFDGAYRIPFVARWPEGIKNPGRTVDEIVNLCDFSPTLTELADAEPTADPSGKSMVPFLRDETPTDWPDAFYNQCNGVECYITQRMVRTHKWKLVYTPTNVDELYDLENDPHEMVNLIDDPKLEEVKKELFIKLWRKATEERDYMSGYHTQSLAPYGPAFALGKPGA
jgi:arylsulfatase A-like enzyme